MKLYVIYSLRVAAELCHQGFRVVKTEPNRDKPWLYVYLFEDTPQLRQALKEVTGNG